ncbi:calcium-binding protein [Paraliomyxa miuraensis]|uniref:calcium-binding protein n=1 Tax=Paraliomyxa miuraensis TaxID=376150 RepID=UPI0022537331|nr:calcium-binding protein [Paraliomyxa miuraensis]MCX4246801.1 calcium-binding protein [Paraliomyxa miuraensis]
MNLDIIVWKTSLTALGLGSLLLMGCDQGDGNDHGVAETSAGETEGETDDLGHSDDQGDPPPGADTTTSGAPPGTTAGEPPPDEPPPEDEPEACSELGASRACVTDDEQEGTQFCDDLYHSGAAERVWGPCLSAVACEPGDSRSCFGECGEGEDSGGMCGIDEHCNLYDGVPDWDTNQGDWDGCNTPLVLSFDGREPQLSPARAATFDLDGIGGCITTDWPRATTPWLALDRDGNGSIDSGRELFGSGTRLRDGTRAAHGFEALAELDDDGNGIIDVRDAGFSRLVLWGDHDEDRRSTFAETEDLSRRQVLSIELGYRVQRQCDDRGNCGVERASFTFIDEHGQVRQGEVVDLHLACQ